MFDQKKYIAEYKKQHYARLSVDLAKKDKEKLVGICNEQGITIKKFILNAIGDAEKKKK